MSAISVRDKVLKQAQNLQNALNSKDGQTIMAAVEREYGKETPSSASAERLMFLCGCREVLGYLRDVSTSTYEEKE